MHLLRLMLKIALICMVLFSTSCSDKEEVYYYSFKDIEYSVEEEDGMIFYETDWEVLQTIVNSSKDREVEAGPGDLYQGFHEYYYFECKNPADFNPTVGYVHLRLPQTLSLGNQIVYDDKEGEYSMDPVEVNRSYEGKVYRVPSQTKLTLERKIEMRKLVLSYKAIFQRHPSGKDFIVEGKFFRYVPENILLVEKYEPTNK